MKKMLTCLFLGVLSICIQPVWAQDNKSMEDKPVYGVEQMPQFPGGEEALMKFIKDNLRYPAKAAEIGIEGRVTIRFVVAKTGEVTDVTVIRGLESNCDAEAVRVVKMMPTWTPGRMNGQDVPVYYTIPIVYKLNKEVNSNPLLIVDGEIKPYSMYKDSFQLKPWNIESISVLKDTTAVKMYGQKAKCGAIIITTKTHVLQTAGKDAKPVYGADVMPKFPGGEEALLNFIRDNLKYPTSEAQYGVQGRTTIRFVVTKTGKVSDITVLRSLSPGCDAEAIRVIRLMPDWIPGSIKGVPVDVYYVLPIVYTLRK